MRSSTSCLRSIGARPGWLSEVRAGSHALQRAGNIMLTTEHLNRPDAGAPDRCRGCPRRCRQAPDGSKPRRVRPMVGRATSAIRPVRGAPSCSRPGNRFSSPRLAGFGCRASCCMARSDGSGRLRSMPCWRRPVHGRKTDTESQRLGIQRRQRQRWQSEGEPAHAHDPRLARAWSGCVWVCLPVRPSGSGERLARSGARRRLVRHVGSRPDSGHVRPS